MEVVDEEPTINNLEINNMILQNESLKDRRVNWDNREQIRYELPAYNSGNETLDQSIHIIIDQHRKVPQGMTENIIG